MNNQENKIPKIIHYFWFGKTEKNDLIKSCIASWKLKLPDYQIFEWNEENYNVESNAYTKQAYSNGKYAFVSDFARFDILYQYGGIYLDVDVEILSNLDEFILHDAFMGFESHTFIAPGLIMGSVAKKKFLKDMMLQYESSQFDYGNNVLNLTTVGERITYYLLKRGLIRNNKFQIIDKIAIYPKDYFAPTKNDNGVLIKPETVSIHHYNASWVNSNVKTTSLFKRVIRELILIIKLEHFMYLFKSIFVRLLVAFRRN